MWFGPGLIVRAASTPAQVRPPVGTGMLAGAPAVSHKTEVRAERPLKSLTVPFPGRNIVKEAAGFSPE